MQLSVWPLIDGCRVMRRPKGYDLFDFDMLGLNKVLLNALKAGGFDTPTPIQNQAIPLALDGHDILGLAQTGTGKTLAFGLPLIAHLMEENTRPQTRTARALILAPTRELVNQIADSLRVFTINTQIKIATVVGGQSIGRQIGVMARGTDILVATPGRLIDLMDRGAVDLRQARHLVLDEADQMLDLGFIHALRRIAPALGTPRQTMLFSATMPKQMEELSRAYLTNPRKVQVAPPGKAADKVTQSVRYMDKGAKPGVLREILNRDRDALTLVFARTKHGAEKLMNGLVADGFNAASIHGNKSQGQRDRAIKAFRDGTINVLVATDVAARGIDIPGVRHVYLASGSCMPLRPIPELQAYLASRPRTDFIESVTTADVGWTIGGLDRERFTLRFPFSWRKNRWLFDTYVSLQRRLGYRRRIPAKLVPHLGSQWWCLTRETLSSLRETEPLAEPEPDRKRITITASPVRPGWGSAA
jgi:ATP-dependent RNA helicase RhlE